MSQKTDYRQELTGQIIALIEAGAAPWQQSWESGLHALCPLNPNSGRRYRGINHLHLVAVSFKKGYADSRWMTYRQAREHGWQVRQGEKGTLIEFWKWPDRNQKVSAGEGRLRRAMPLCIHSSVFNAMQIDGIPEMPRPALTWDPNEKAEAALSASGARLFHDQPDRAYYDVARDEIHLPRKEQFHSESGYYGVAMHELGHWTGHASRLNRIELARYGSPEYAKEELRAELASYFLSVRLGVVHDPAQHASYVGYWVGILKKDKNEIFRAARDAEKIVDYILQFGEPPNDRRPDSRSTPEIREDGFQNELEPA